MPKGAWSMTVISHCHHRLVPTMPPPESERRLCGAAGIRSDSEPAATRTCNLSWDTCISKWAPAAEPPQCLVHMISPMHSDPLHGLFSPAKEQIQPGF